MDGPNSKAAAFLLWMGWIFGFGGLHRFYLGKPVSGLLYLLTWGFFGVGQVIDLFRLPAMVEEENLQLAERQQRLLGAGGRGHELGTLGESRAVVPAQKPVPIKIALTRAAAKHNGMLSVTQAVMDTGKPFKEVEEALNEMLHSGYVNVDNHPDTGVVVYTFGELA